MLVIKNITSPTNKTALLKLVIVFQILSSINIVGNYIRSILRILLWISPLLGVLPIEFCQNFWQIFYFLVKI